MAAAPEASACAWASPHGHRKTTTLVAGLRMTGMVAPMVLDGPINPVLSEVEGGDWCEAYAAQVLVPDLRPGELSSWTTSPATNGHRSAS